eukprot:CAMPEP_0185016420 /NCGR_PEP_ID=MMETSP1098-20130426/100359_1 /TAXON_ID=89044 /ORGANISM="Spumella elongata, Strain CCAP 955/1" /LENGTH=405 /DNA_ID=CAMNT_0027545613 /DNA_START=240 /DNA_END=1457 /DNA_ORIENTATION=+
MNGLSNQLFGIYSYVPVALLWNMSLIVGDVYSRDSFQNAMAKYEGWNSMPFSSFFDFDHFQTTWLKRGLAVLELAQFEKACGYEKYQSLTVTREPAFWPNKDLVINQMLEKAEISLPLPDYTVLQFDALRPKFTAMYNYWKGGMRNKLLLLHVHRSLRPAKAIRKVVSAVLRELPNPFFVAHVRLEGDFLLHEETSFEKELESALLTIDKHHCLQHLPRNAAGQIMGAPGIYLASGLFNSTTSSGTTKDKSEISNTGLSVHEKRALILLQRLQKMGFNEIYTREGVLERVVNHINSNININPPTKPNYPMSDNNTDGGVDDYRLYSLSEQATLLQSIRTLVPEQSALVDLTVARGCQCFISSHYASSFSYMAQRMRVMDKGQVLRYPEIGDNNFGKSGYFKQWGV